MILRGAIAAADSRAPIDRLTRTLTFIFHSEGVSVALVKSTDLIGGNGRWFREIVGRLEFYICFVGTELSSEVVYLKCDAI